METQFIPILHLKFMDVKSEVIFYGSRPESIDME